MYKRQMKGEDWTMDENKRRAQVSMQVMAMKRGIVMKTQERGTSGRRKKSLINDETANGCLTAVG